MQFRDEEGQVLNGRYIVYSSEGYCDTIGQYVNGKREGAWRVLTPKGRTLQQLDYSDGVLTGLRDSVQLQEEARKRRDSPGGVGAMVEIESEFPGGAHGWVQYMLHRLRYPQRAFERHIEGKPAVTFMVDSEGRIETGDMYMQRSVEYSIDQTVLQLIRDSPAWTPATQDGRPVRSYKTQPFGFKLPAK
jgi:protein TonB